METQNKGIVHVPGSTKEDSPAFHGTQNSVQFEMYELFISGIFHLIFLNELGWQQIIETVESEISNKEGLL